MSAKRIYTLAPRDEGGPNDPGGGLCVEVALNAPRMGPLTYRVPPGLADSLSPGMRVMVPLGRRRMTVDGRMPDGTRMMLYE